MAGPAPPPPVAPPTAPPAAPSAPPWGWPGPAAPGPTIIVGGQAPARGAPSRWVALGVVASFLIAGTGAALYFGSQSDWFGLGGKSAPAQSGADAGTSNDGSGPVKQVPSGDGSGGSGGGSSGGGSGGGSSGGGSGGPSGGPDTTPPALSAVSAGNVAATSAVVAWTVSDAGGGVQSRVEYRRDSPLTTAFDTSSPMQQGTGGKNYALSNLVPNSRYIFRVYARDGAGNDVRSADQTFQTTTDLETGGGDGTPPVISNIVHVIDTSTRVTVTWKVTDNAAMDRSYVQYGPGSYALQSGNALGAGDQEAVIKNLLPNTRYSYRVYALDAAGNSATSESGSFVTPAI